MRDQGAITLVLADGHVLLRKSVRMLLEQDADLAVVGETSDGPETLRLVETLRPAKLVIGLALAQACGRRRMTCMTRPTP